MSRKMASKRKLEKMLKMERKVEILSMRHTVGMGKRKRREKEER